MEFREIRLAQHYKTVILFITCNDYVNKIKILEIFMPEKLSVKIDAFSMSVTISFSWSHFYRISIYSPYRLRGFSDGSYIRFHASNSCAALAFL